MSEKTYAEYLADDKQHHDRMMAKYGVGPVPKSFSGDTSLLNGAPVQVKPASITPDMSPTPTLEPETLPVNDVVVPQPTVQVAMQF